jgi:hypothetical protein
MPGHCLHAIALGAAILVISAPPATAAPTGTLTTAETDSGWTKAHIAGSMTEDGVLSGYGPDYPAHLVEWRPVVTVAPSLPAYACDGTEPLDSDPNTTNAYWGPTQTTPGTFPFDIPNAAILNGVYGQRACLTEVATVSAQQAVCIVQAPILGMDPHACPFVQKIVSTVAAGKLITLAPPPTTPDDPAPTPTLTLGRSEALAQARKALKRQLRSFQRGHARKILITKTINATRRRCRASWTYHGYRYRATVTVTELVAGYQVAVTGRHRRRLQKSASSVAHTAGGRSIRATPDHV